MAKRAVGYCRISTLMQIDNTSLKDQEDKVRMYAKLHDIAIDKMFIDNQIKAINLDKDIQNYEMINSKLYKNNILYIDFDNDFNDFLNQVDGNQKELKQELMQNIDLY